MIANLLKEGINLDLGGYSGRIPYVDLNRGDYYVEGLRSDQAGKYIVGTGLSAYLMSSFPFGYINPLGPENPLIF